MKILRKFNLIIFVFCIVFLNWLYFLLSACTPKWVSMVSNATNIIWSSEDPNCKILILQENPGCGFGYLDNDGSKIDIFFRWGNAAFTINFATEYSATYYSPFTGQFSSIDGNYSSKNNDKEAYLTIYTDTMFAGKFVNKIIKLEKQNIDLEKIDAKYRNNINWNAINVKLSFDITSNERVRGLGHIQYKESFSNIIFYWQDNLRFSVYELQGDIQSESPILTGTYTSSNLKATLTIENDLIFNHEFETIELVAKGLNDS